jgi:hypothetical protein
MIRREPVRRRSKPPVTPERAALKEGTMRKRAASRFVFLVAIVGLWGFAGPTTAFSAPPANDAFAGAPGDEPRPAG